MMPNALTELAEISQPRIKLAVQLGLFRSIMKLVAVGSAANVIIVPIVQQDRTRVAIWKLVDECPGGQNTILVVTYIASALLLSAILFPRIRLVGGVLFAFVLSTWALLPYQGAFSNSLIITAMVGVALAVLGAEVVD